MCRSDGRRSPVQPPQADSADHSDWNRGNLIAPNDRHDPFDDVWVRRAGTHDVRGELRRLQRSGRSSSDPSWACMNTWVAMEKRDITLPDPSRGEDDNGPEAAGRPAFAIAAVLCCRILTFGTACPQPPSPDRAHPARPWPNLETSAGARISRPLSIRKRIGAQLKLDNQRARSGFGRRAWSTWRRRVDSLDVKGRAVARRNPQFAALPTSVRVIDAPL